MNTFGPRRWHGLKFQRLLVQEYGRKRGGDGEMAIRRGGRVREGGAQGKSREVFSKHNSSGVSSLVVKAAARDPPKLQDICLDASFLALWAQTRSSL